MVGSRDVSYHTRNLGTQRLGVVDGDVSDVGKESENEKVYSRSAVLVGRDRPFGTDELVEPSNLIAVGHVG